MSRYYLFQDTDQCIGCHTCTIQCKSAKDLPAGPKISQIIEVGPAFIGDLPKASYVFMPCFHCENPWCVAACPTGAMHKRETDGIVHVMPDLCVGCKACVTACPFGAAQFNTETGKAVKCDYCMDRVDQGFKPACVTVCMTRCLDFGKVEDLTRLKRERFAKTVAESVGLK